MRRALFLLAPNIGAPLILALHGEWQVAAVLYCLGNGFWIVRSARRPRSENHDQDRLISAWLPALVMTLGGLALGVLGEPRGTVNDGLAWDGRHYAALYSFFSSGAFVPIQPAFPYSQRVALPYLAAHVHLAAPDAFLLLHAMFWAATMVLFAICCRCCFGLRTSSILFAVLWLQILWASIPRSAAGYRFTVDSASLFFVQAWILLVLSQRLRWAALLCAGIGVLFKETVLLVALLSLAAIAVLWIVPRFRQRLPPGLRELRLAAIIPFSVAVAAAVLGKSIAGHAVQAGPFAHGSEWDTIRAWASRRYHDPMAWLRYVGAAFSAYGGFALLRAATIGRPRRAPRPWPLLFAKALSVLYFGVCFVAGSDLTRFAVLAFPFALPALLTALDDVSLEFVVLGLLLGLPSAHAFTPIAAPFRALPAGDLTGLYSWVMEYAHPAILGSWIAWWLGSVMLLRSLAFSRAWRPQFDAAVVAPVTDALTGRPQSSRNP